MRPNYGKNQAGWRRIMAGLKAEPLGVFGSTVENLGWRLTQGGERLQRDPKAIAVLIGINNVYKRLAPPAPALDTVVAWLRATHPTSKCAAGGGGGGWVCTARGEAAGHVRSLIPACRSRPPLPARCRVLVLALLPTTKAKASDLARVNRQYSDLARRRGAQYAPCGQQLNPRDKKLLNDGLHLTTKGHDALLACLRKAAGL